jgi:Uma2 family endonuclease
VLVQAEHRFSVSDYYRMGETGVLKPGALVELLDGKIIDMSPIGPFHGATVNRLNRHFNKMASGRWLVSTQNPVHLDEHSEPQPDLMLLKPAPDDYASRHPAPEDVILQIEVADSTLTYDREQKLPIYGRAGIAEVWIVNLLEKTIEIHREPHFSGYGYQRVVRSSDKASPAAFPDSEISAAELLKLGN